MRFVGQKEGELIFRTSDFLSGLFARYGLRILKSIKATPLEIKIIVKPITEYIRVVLPFWIFSGLSRAIKI